VTGCVLFYVQHLLGIGHLRRALRIAAALAHEGIRVTLVSGGEPLSGFEGAAAHRIVQLPPIKARDAGFKELVDTAGRPIDDKLRDGRRATLLAAFAAARPDVILIEAFPFGRRAFRFELDPLIHAAWSRRPRPLVLCSIRDIVVAQNDSTRRREIVDRVRADFDYVLVHGDPTFIALEASFPAASEIADRLVYTGYVGETDSSDGVGETAGSGETVGTGEVVVSVGGGAVGGALLSAALETRRQGFLAGLAWRLLAGPNLPEAEFEGLADSLPRGVVLERYRADFSQILRRCRVSVSQAGYNTVLDILAARATAVVVPFASERETEQSLRAERLAACGILEMVRESDLSAERLARAIERAMTRHPGEIAIATGGARCAAALIASMIRSPTGAAGRVVENLCSSRRTL
jgi:predicted glycosyltransferase